MVTRKDRKILLNMYEGVAVFRFHYCIETSEYFSSLSLVLDKMN